jgi:uncharacterized protein YndB with AHSA1/START domain
MADELPASRPDTDDVSDGDAADRTLGVVTRSIEVDADPADVWRSVTDPAERALWLDDPDALARHVRVDESAPGQRLVWTWWHPGDEGDASTVSVVLRPADGGGTRVVVTESLPSASPLGGTLRAASACGSSAGVARRSPSWIRCARDRWDSRLLGLELLLVAARAGIV